MALILLFLARHLLLSVHGVTQSTSTPLSDGRGQPTGAPTQPPVIPPTASNSSHQLYMNRNGTVNCNVTYCHIICDEYNGCLELIVNASLSTTLIIECSAPGSCKTFTVNGPTTNMNLHCTNEKSCMQGRIYADNTANIDIKCNSSASSASAWPCYQLTLNASKASLVNISCVYDHDCVETNFYFNNTGYASFNIEGKYGLWMANIYAQNMLNGLDIACNAEDGCKSMTVYASNIQSSLFMSCNDNDACYQSTIYCPDDYLCNIDCPTGSCGDMIVHVDNKKYDSLDLKCITVQSCSQVFIMCDDTTLSTGLYWNAAVGYYVCKNNNCCPFISGNIICPANSDCLVDCASRSCKNYYINGTKANSLSLVCNGNGCTNTKIECPTGENTSCDIDCTAASCQYASIHTGPDNIMKSFALNCGPLYCQFVSLSLNSNNITDLVIICDGDNACQYMSFDSDSMVLVNKLMLSCGGSYSCGGIVVNISSISSTINCTADHSCSSMSIQTGDNEMENFILNCDGDYGCYSLEANVASSVATYSVNCKSTHSCHSEKLTIVNNAIIKSFSMSCSTRPLSCDLFKLKAIGATIDNMDIDCGDCGSMEIDAHIGHNADINCNFQYGCKQTDINLTLISNGNVNIDCIQPSSSSGNDDPACYQAEFNIYGTLYDTKTANNNLSLMCGQLDCQFIYLFASNLYTVDVNCNGSYSCHSASINAESSEHFHLNCGKYESCYGTTIYCPYKDINVCNIKCSQSALMDIFVPVKYTYNYLDITCPSKKNDSSSSCYQLELKCIDGSQIIHETSLMYDSIEDKYVCQDATCCYYYNNATVQTTSISLTTSTINLPSTMTNDSNNTNVSKLYSFISILVAIIIALIALIGYIDSKYYHKNDMFQISCIVIFGVYTMDFLSDIFFAVTVLDRQYWTIFVPLCIFLVIPMILNLIELSTSIISWIGDEENGSFIMNYLNKYAKLLYCLALISGSGFAAIQLLNSGIFRLYIFDMGLKQHQMASFQNKRLFSIVLLENCPQIVLQTIFAYNTGDFTGIPLMSLIFSLFSIILSIFEYFTKKSIAKQQTEKYDIYSIKFDVISDDVWKNKRSLRYQKVALNGKMAEILKVDHSCIEQLRSMDINDGLKLIFRVKIEKINSMKYEKLNEITKGAVSNGLMTESIKNAWKLQTVPIIKNLDIHLVANTKQHNIQQVQLGDVNQYQLLE